MSRYIGIVKRTFNLHLPTIFGDVFERQLPDTFEYNGSQIYHGMQGRGKTLSMVYHSQKLKQKYPKLLLVSNIRMGALNPVSVTNARELDEIMSSDAFLSGDWQQSNYLYYQTHDTLLLLLRRARNAGEDRDGNHGAWGTHFLIDEIHQYFHSHDSKSMPVWVVTIFSQQRKQFILITGTVQVWDNVIKALREQIQNLIGCDRIGWLIRQTVVDPLEFESQYGERIAPIKKRGFFFMTRKIRDSYDTRALVNSGREIFGGSDMNVRVDVNEQQNKKGIFATKRRR